MQRMVPFHAGLQELYLKDRSNSFGIMAPIVNGKRRVPLALLQVDSSHSVVSSCVATASICALRRSTTTACPTSADLTISTRLGFDNWFAALDCLVLVQDLKTRSRSIT